MARKLHHLIIGLTILVFLPVLKLSFLVFQDDVEDQFISPDVTRSSSSSTSSDTNSSLLGKGVKGQPPSPVSLRASSPSTKSSAKSSLLDENVAEQSASPAPKGSSSSLTNSDTNFPKTLVIYFPQYHRDPLNDKNWGENFTDWVSLQKTDYNNKLNQSIPRPLLSTGTSNMANGSISGDLPPPLGYYDLSETEPRRIQGILAKKFGIDGFIYHHYWFYDQSHKGPNLAKPLENMLKDGHPDVPFMLNWCAVKWVNVWMGKAIFQTIPTNKNRAITLQDQYFDVTQEMIYEHYLWLKPFFNHPNYIRVDGQPAFFLYYYDDRALPILESLRRFAIEDGFSGLHFIVGRSSHNEQLYDTSHLEEREKKSLNRKAQGLDLVDPSKTEVKTKSILPVLFNVTETSMSSLLQLDISGAQQEKGAPREMQTWDYNPFNQTMTYPYPLDYLTRPLEVPAWCTDPSKNFTTLDESGYIQPHHPEIIGIITTFDNTPRRQLNGATVWNGGLKDALESPDDAIERFTKSYTAALYHQKCCIDIALARQQEKQTKGRNSNPDLKFNVMKSSRFVTINAMNEWAEGMSIEPSDIYGYRWLEAIKAVQKTVKNQPCRD